VGILKTGDAPKSLDYWQGRKEEIDQLHKWLADENIRLIGIEGIGGTGKSMLATKIYEEIPEFPKRFWADVSSGATIFSDLARRVLTDFGETAPDDELKLVNALVQCLRSRQYLLIIDNLETLLDSERNWKSQFYEEFFRIWLEHGKLSKIIVTTRERPNLTGFEWLPLKGLKTEDGAALLQALGIQGKLSAFAELVAGHPLLLKIVANLIKEEYPQDSNLKRLADLGLGNLRELLSDPRVVGSHRTKNVGMVLVLDASFERLADWQKIWLQNLSVFRIAFDADAAMAMFSKSDDLSFDKNEAEQELRKLVKRSLLEEQLNPQRQFSFQPVILEYLRYKAGDQTEANQRAINYYSQTRAEEASWQTIEDLKECLEIFYHLYQLEKYDNAFYTVRACDNFLTLRGYYIVQFELYEQLVTAWQQVNVEEDWKYIASLISLGNTYYLLGQYHKAIELYRHSQKIQRLTSDYSEASVPLIGLGNVYCLLGQYEKAIKYYQKSLVINRNIGDAKRENSSLIGLGSVYCSLGQYEKAIQYYQKSLVIQKNIKDIVGESKSLGNLGIAYFYLNDYQTAIKHHKHALNIAQKIEDRNWEGSCLSNLGNAYYSLKQYRKAIELYQQSLTIKREIGDIFGEATSLGNLGTAYHSLKDYQKAIDFQQESLKCERTIGNLNGEASCLMNLGNVHNSLGKYRKAIKFYQQSLEIKREIGSDQTVKINSLTGLGHASYSLGEYQQAISFYQQSLEIQRNIGDRHGEVKSLQNLADSYNICGRVQEGFAAAYQAQSIRQELELTLEAMPFPKWIKSLVKYAQRGKLQLIVCFIFGLIAFPFALVFIVFLLLWRLTKRLFSR